MNAAPDLAKPFELHGEYAGFVRTLVGQRRMLLRRGGEEILLKVPKELRHILDERLVRGQQIVLWGAEVIEKRSGLPRMVVARVQFEQEGGSREVSSSCLVCPILICSKKNCWRNGGKDLYVALDRALVSRGLREMVELHEVSCLGHCERAPNCAWDHHEFHRCTPKDAVWIVDQIAGEIRG